MKENRTRIINKKRGVKPLSSGEAGATSKNQPTSNRLMEETLAVAHRRSQALAKALADARDEMRKVSKGLAPVSSLAATISSIDKVLKDS